MKVPRRRTHAALAALALLLSAAGAEPSGDAAAPSREAEAELRELARLVNEHRGKIGCPPLEWHRRLAVVARRHSEDMAGRGFFGHVNPDGEDPFDRIRDALIEYRVAGENVAAGHASAVQVFNAWMRSRRHRANLENCAYTHHGIGLHRGRWTHVFVGLSPSSPP